MNPTYLAAAGAALIGFTVLGGYTVGVGNSGPILLKKVTADRPQFMRPDAADAFNAMVERARLDGVTLLAGSAFRNVLEQTALYAEYVNRFFNPPTVAKPGTSNHGNGTAVDVADAPGRSLTYASSGFRWMTANASEFGFSWDEGSKVNEPWHWRFVG